MLLELPQGPVFLCSLSAVVLHMRLSFEYQELAGEQDLHFLVSALKGSSSPSSEAALSLPGTLSYLVQFSHLPCVQVLDLLVLMFQDTKTHTVIILPPNAIIRGRARSHT